MVLHRDHEDVVERRHGGRSPHVCRWSERDRGPHDAHQGGGQSDTQQEASSFTARRRWFEARLVNSRESTRRMRSYPGNPNQLSAYVAEPIVSYVLVSARWLLA